MAMPTVAAAHAMPLPPLSRRTRTLWLAVIVASMAIIFTVDTAAHYEVAVAVFHTVVILTAARVLHPRTLVWLSAGCLGLTALSFALTSHGDYHAGLVNLAISILAIVMVTWLLLKREAARDQAHAAQAQLLRLAQVQHLEGLTTAIAHEVNQPLAAIVASGHACQRWLQQVPPNLPRAAQALDRILGDAGRASQIIARVRSLSRGEPVQAIAFALNPLVMEIIALSRDEMERHHIELTLDLAPALPQALADPVQIRQVLGNLFINAIEALASVPARKRTIMVTSKVHQGMLVCAVRDSGPGIPAAIQAHLFDAFWTTKTDGVGVGLSISRTMIEANGGHIHAESAAAGGAVFQFTLPVATEEPAT